MRWTLLLSGLLLSWLDCPHRLLAADREAWEYTGGYGLSRIIDCGQGKWVNYTTEGTTFVYSEIKRTPQFIELEQHPGGGIVRLFNNRGEMKRSNGTWRRFTTAKWIAKPDIKTLDRLGLTDYRIKLIYFVPTDRQPIKNYRQKIHVVVSLVKELIEQDLRSKGLPKAKIPIESENGQSVVHLLRGKKNAAFYNGAPTYDPAKQFSRIGREIKASLSHPARHVMLVFAETWEDGPAKEAWRGHIARGSGLAPDGGLAIYSTWVLKDEFCALTIDEQKKKFLDTAPVAGRKAFGHRGPNSPRFEFLEDAFGAVWHETGHALGLRHDYRDTRHYVMGSGFRNLRWNVVKGRSRDRVGFSRDNALLLNCSRYVNSAINKLDYTPAKVDVTMNQKGKGPINVTIKASDSQGLRAYQLVDRSRAGGSVILGKSLRGTRQTIRERLPSTHFKDGKFVLEVVVADSGGNLTQVRKILEVGK